MKNQNQEGRLAEETELCEKCGTKIEKMEIVDEENSIFLMSNKVIRCARCGKMIGKIVFVDNQECLAINSIVVTVLRGVCECGEEFHWSISERTLAKLINRVKQC
jgi:NAD-dependent SIR2 family protein deacetylase